MTTHANLVKGGKIGTAAQMRDAAGMHNSGTQKVDELFLDQVLAIPDGIEHLSHRQGRHGMLANQAETRLVLGRSRVLD